MATRHRVPARTIDSVIAVGDAEPPDLIKMDIQGGELKALNGAVGALQNVKALLLETWLTRSYGEETPLLAELSAFLTPFGFRIFDFGDGFRSDDGALYSVDACFVRD